MRIIGIVLVVLGLVLFFRTARKGTVEERGIHEKRSADDGLVVSNGIVNGLSFVAAFLLVVTGIVFIAIGH